LIWSIPNIYATGLPTAAIALNELATCHNTIFRKAIALFSLPLLLVSSIDARIATEKKEQEEKLNERD